MQIARLKTFQAIKIGSETTFIDIETHPNTSITLDGQLITVQWSGGTIITSIANVCWMVPKETKHDVKRPSPPSSGRAKQTKSGKTKVGKL